MKAYYTAGTIEIAFDLGDMDNLDDFIESIKEEAVEEYLDCNLDDIKSEAIEEYLEENPSDDFVFKSDFVFCQIKMKQKSMF